MGRRRPNMVRSQSLNFWRNRGHSTNQPYNKPPTCFWDAGCWLVVSKPTRCYCAINVYTMAAVTCAGLSPAGLSPVLAGAGDLSPVTGETKESGQRKRMRPASTKEKLKVKLDRVVEHQGAAQQQHEKHLGEMRLMFQKQHERVTLMKGLVKAISNKNKKARQTEHSGSSSSS